MSRTLAEIAPGKKARLWTFWGLVIPILFILTLRWLWYEPFMIPSGSMMPTLLEGDFVVVKKSAYGVRLPFGNAWITRWQDPQMAVPTVFKNPKNLDQFYVKRLVAGPGDRIAVKNGRLWINNQPLEQTFMRVDEMGYEVFQEEYGDIRYDVRYSPSYGSLRDVPERLLGRDEYFFVGDNRDRSSDSRRWGVVPIELIVGPVRYIWLSCANDVKFNPLACDITGRMDRIMQPIGAAR